MYYLFAVVNTLNAFEQDLQDTKSDVALYQDKILQIKGEIVQLSEVHDIKKQSLDSILGEIASLTIVMEVSLIDCIFH